ncbi:MAG: low temperature requirement protein A, partial [Sphingomonadaceae bacterium]|nr:low temperature requirement protein A [Sphingomonadaceae bacterium]
MAAESKSAKRSLLREVGPDGHATVGYAELFFDLVYVFAITQLSHYLLAHHDLAGVLETLMLFLAVWWAWTYMAWATNWLDPERPAVRIMIFLVMLASLAMSASIPGAFGDKGLVFALAYLAMQIGRTGFLVRVMRRERPETSRNLLRANLWFVLSAPFWIWGALAAEEMRLILWGVAIAINYAAPMALFWIPGLGYSATTDFGLSSGGHMAERCALLIIIALGEGVLVTGATFAGMAWGWPAVAAFLTAFAGSVAMWWVYFDLGMRRAAHHIEHHADAGRVARDIYTYAHIPIVAGIVVTAVCDEMMLAHPRGHAEPLFLWVAIGGPALFLAGAMVLKRATSGRSWWPLSHLVGLGLFGLIALWGAVGHPAPLALGIASVAVLAVVAAWEWGSFHGGWIERGVPVPRRLREYGERR